MGRIYDAMTAWFDKDEWKYEPLQDTVIRMGFQGTNGRWQCYAQAREETQQFVFYSVSPINTPEGRRAAMAEFITRANYGMMIGNFEMDFSDGEVRYKTSVDVEDTELNAALMKPLIYANVSTMDRYFPGISSVAHAATEPSIAIAEIEGIPGSEPS